MSGTADTKGTPPTSLIKQINDHIQKKTVIDSTLEKAMIEWFNQLYQDVEQPWLWQLPFSEAVETGLFFYRLLRPDITYFSTLSVHAPEFYQLATNKKNELKNLLGKPPNTKLTAPDIINKFKNTLNSYADLLTKHIIVTNDFIKSVTSHELIACIANVFVNSKTFYDYISAYLECIGIKENTRERACFRKLLIIKTTLAICHRIGPNISETDYNNLIIGPRDTKAIIELWDQLIPDLITEQRKNPLAPIDSIPAIKEITTSEQGEQKSAAKTPDNPVEKQKRTPRSSTGKAYNILTALIKPESPPTPPLVLTPYEEQDIFDIIKKNSRSDKRWNYSAKNKSFINDLLLLVESIMTNWEDDHGLSISKEALEKTGIYRIVMLLKFWRQNHLQQKFSGPFVPTLAFTGLTKTEPNKILKLKTEVYYQEIRKLNKVIEKLKQSSPKRDQKLQLLAIIIEHFFNPTVVLEFSKYISEIDQHRKTSILLPPINIEKVFGLLKISIFLNLSELVLETPIYYQELKDFIKKQFPNEPLEDALMIDTIYDHNKGFDPVLFKRLQETSKQSSAKLESAFNTLCQELEASGQQLVPRGTSSEDIGLIVTWLYQKVTLLEQLDDTYLNFPWTRCGKWLAAKINERDKKIVENPTFKEALAKIGKIENQTADAGQQALKSCLQKQFFGECYSAAVNYLKTVTPLEHNPTFASAALQPSTSSFFSMPFFKQMPEEKTVAPTSTLNASAANFFPVPRAAAPPASVVSTDDPILADFDEALAKAQRILAYAKDLLNRPLTSPASESPHPGGSQFRLSRNSQ